MRNALKKFGSTGVVLIAVVSGALLGLFYLQVFEARQRIQLQRGARIFSNFCAGCHSLRYLTYQDIAHKLNLLTVEGRVDTRLVSTLQFSSAKLTEPLASTIAPEDQKKWFIQPPPDLSFSAETHGKNWVVAYMHGFYKDSRQAFGSNNRVLKNGVMPNVMDAWSRQISTGEFDQAVVDVAEFLQYAAAPEQIERYRIGIVVIAFLLIWCILMYQLRKFYPLK